MKTVMGINTGSSSIRRRSKDRRKQIDESKFSEEKIGEYLAKKAMKVAKKLKSQNGYNHADDFKPFVWKKKIERDVTQGVLGVPLDILSVKAAKKRQKERMAEILKIKSRNEERAVKRYKTVPSDHDRKDNDEVPVSSEPIPRHEPMNNGDDEVIENSNEVSLSSELIPRHEPMNNGDEVIENINEVNVDSQVEYGSHDIYVPRKPKYNYRVQTGYEWNSYNQTHYPRELNPPPKIVQGYKFDIFYPDLDDKIKAAPSYEIEKDGDSAETCIIRFHAGPPYEDIAFHIVNKEWEYSHKKGFKCTFESGILRLYFNFKRYRYRR